MHLFLAQKEPSNNGGWYSTMKPQKHALLPSSARLIR